MIYCQYCGKPKNIPGYAQFLQLRHEAICHCEESKSLFYDPAKPPVISTLINDGWRCPKCGNIYAPFWYECANCNIITGNNKKEIK